MRFYEILKEYTAHLNLRKSLFEIDFNSKSVIQTALNAPISCGFEAETIWRGLTTAQDDADRSAHWFDIEDELNRTEREKVFERYESWISETKVDEFLSEVVDEFINEAFNDRYYMRLFLERDDLKSEYSKYVSDLKDEQDDVDAESTVVMLSFIEGEYEDAYGEFLYELVNDWPETWENADKRARREYPITDWIWDEYENNALAMLRDLDIVIELDDDDDDDSAAKRQIVSDIIKSTFGKEAKVGGYHSTGSYDTTPDYWRVEPDPSISSNKSDVEGIEIISPVYSTPAEMLSDIRRLFELFQKYDVYTDDSTGFHVTMSMQGDISEKNPNKLKMALLLGDKYLLQQFDRASNEFTTSRMEELEKAAQRLVNKPDLTNIGAIEKELSDAMVRTKYRSINFKPAANPDGNQLVEFRIAGNDYLKNTSRLEKAIIKYSTVMLAGHDKSAYSEDYAKAILKLINRMKTPQGIEQVVNSIPNTPFVNGVQNFFKIFGAGFDDEERILIKRMLDKIYQVNENDTVDTVKVKAFFELLFLLVTKVTMNPNVKIPSNVVLGMRKGFSELNVDYNDFLKFLAKKEMTSQYLLNELVQGFRKLIGSSKVDVRPEDMPPTFVVEENYQYLAPWHIVARANRKQDIDPADLEKIIKVPAGELKNLKSAFQFLTANDTGVEDEIFQYYENFNKKYNIFFYDKNLFPKYKKFQDALQNANYERIYELFPIQSLIDHGIKIVPKQ